MSIDDMRLRPSAIIIGSVLVFAAVAAGTFVFRAGLLARSASESVIIDADGPTVLSAATTSIRWAGYTTTTYTGLIGSGFGIKNASQICNNLYPGSHWASTFDIIHLGTSYPWSLNAWLANLYYDASKDCNHWASNSASYSGTNAGTQTIFAAGTNSGWTCNNLLYLACVYQP